MSRTYIDRFGNVALVDTHAPSCPNPNDPTYPDNGDTCWLDEYRATHDDTPTPGLCDGDECGFQ